MSNHLEKWPIQTVIFYRKHLHMKSSDITTVTVKSKWILQARKKLLQVLICKGQ